MDCIFCKIIVDQAPSTKVYEDEKFLAFLDIAPTAKGHTLVAPKGHSVNVLDASTATLSDLMPVVQKVAQAVVRATGAEGCTISVNNGRAAHQLVDHLHFHIIPRRQGDGLEPWPHSKYEEGEMQVLGEIIKTELKTQISNQ